MRFSVLIFILIFIFACTSNNSTEEKAVNAQLKLYNSNPTDSTAQAVIQSMSKYIEVKGLKDSTSARYILQSAQISEKHRMHNQALGFYKVYLINYPERPDQTNRLAEVINIIDTLGKPDLSQVLYRSYVERFPNDARTETYRSKIDRTSVSVDSLLKEIGLRMFNDSIYRLDENVAHLYVDACEAAVMAQPDLPNAPEYLHRAAETARTLRDIPKAITLYDWIIDRYPNHPRGATSLFLKAFTFDNDLKDFENARVYYEEFLKKYPNNEFEESAKFLLENLGKSEEELKQILEQKSKQNAQQAPAK